MNKTSAKKAVPVAGGKRQKAASPKNPKAPTKGEKQKSPFRQWADGADGSENAAISELCEYVAAGGHLAGFVKEKGFAYVTALVWIQKDTIRTEMYARAREDRADVLADEIVAIADEVQTTTKLDGEDTIIAYDAVAVARNRLRVDARKWAASKLKPRTYGEKLGIGAAEGLDPVQQVFTMSTADLTAIAARQKPE